MTTEAEPKLSTISAVTPDQASPQNKIVENIESAGKLVSLLAVFLFLSGLTLNFGYFTHIQSFYNFIGVADAFSSLLGVLDVLRAGLYWVYLVPILGFIVMTLLYVLQPARKWQVIVGIALLVLSISCGAIIEDYNKYRLFHQTAVLCIILTSFFAISAICILPQVPRDHYMRASLGILIAMWFAASYMNGVVWFIYDTEVSHSNLVYMKTERNDCLYRRVLRNLDAGFLVFEPKHKSLELFVKTKIQYFTLATWTTGCDTPVD